MEGIILIILFILIAILYFPCFYLIFKRKEYSCISIRSPILLVANNFGGFLMNIFLLAYFLNYSNLKNNEKDGEIKKSRFYDVPFAFYLSEIIMITSFIMRCQRIVACCQITESEQSDKDQFAKKRHLYGEKYYVKLLGVCCLLLMLIFVIIFACTSLKGAVPNFLTPSREKEDFRLGLFLIFHFMIIMVLIQYCYLMIVNPVKQKIIIETVLFTILFFLYTNAIAAIDVLKYEFHEVTVSNETQYHIDEKYQEISFAVTFIFLLCSLFLNGYFPVILSYCYRTSIAYHFNPQLMNNLYLFLSNEECYGTFSEYIKDDEEACFFLRVYTHIMKFKLEFLNEELIANCVEEAKDIMNAYFNGPSLSYFDAPTIEKINLIKNEVIGEDNTNCEMFDTALKYSFEKLSNRFLDFKNTVSFDILKKSIATQSYIQCKMSNTGLINKF